jgi:tripartite-type tricarboxylate transporter receptor subunit TctC
MIGRRCMAAAAAGLLVRPAWAQDAVPRSIQLIVPFSAGSIVDLTARAFAEPFRAALGGDVQVVVVNREGAAGTIAATAVARARPDGATLGFGPIGILATQPHLVPGLGYRLADFRILAQAFENIFVLATAAQGPHGSLAALLAAARARPDEVTWGDAGVGTIPNLLVRQVARDAGVRMVHVPYRNIGQMALDVRGGSLGLAVSTLTSLRSPELRLIAVAADRRVAELPEVPTLAELGFQVAARGFGGLWGPAALPAETAARLEAAALAAVADAGYQAFAARTVQLAEPAASAAFSARIAAAEPVLAQLVRELGLGAR